MPAANRCGVIWDVDGTLVDTAELHFAAWQALARELHRPFTREQFAATFGRRNPEIIHEVFGRQYSDQEVTDLGTRKEELYKAAARQQGVPLLPGARALLDGLHRAGFLQAIGSSAPRGNLDLVLGLTQTGPYFQAVVAMEDTQRGKPDPQVFEVAAAKLGVAPAHALVLEDAVAGVHAAKAGHMKCIAVSFVGHHADATLKAAGADRVVRSLEQVSVAQVRRLLDAETPSSAKRTS
jgi:beta-phosphoglucomutase